MEGVREVGWASAPEDPGKSRLFRPVAIETQDEIHVETSVVTLVHNLWQNQDGGGKSIQVLLNSTAAFSTVNHGVLLGQLWRLEVGATVLQWFFSFLCAQFQSKLVGGEK